MNAPKLLVFPANIDACKDFVRHARSLGFQVCGACSVPFEPPPGEFDALHPLPFVTDPGFLPELKALLARLGASHLHAPHHGVWWHLRKLLDEGRLQGVALCAPHPFETYWARFAPSLEWARRQRGDALLEGLPRPPRGLAPALCEAELVALHRQFVAIPGETDEAKLETLVSLARIAPPGDVVEVGVLYGRSGHTLGWLASRYGLGATVCVDPWSAAELTDQGPAASALADEPGFIDYQKIFLEFRANAAAVPGISYIRQPSVAAAQTYRAALSKGRLEAEGLPAVPLSGAISLLHIDGNHRFDHVVADIRSWAPQLAPYGWLMLDDYIWAFGDGPQRAGDELLTSGDYDCAFVASDTLFLRRAPSGA